MIQSTRVCLPDSLQSFLVALFKAIGADDEIAIEVATHLVRANLSGHDSHGVIHAPQYIIEADRGDLRPEAKPTIARDGGITAVVDAQRGFGQFSTAFALEWALRRVRKYGLAAVAIRHSMHIGRLGEYTERAAAQGLVAILTVGDAGPGIGPVRAYGGRDYFVSTNPWSMAISGEKQSMVFDGATSMIATGKIMIAQSQGLALPLGCIVDCNGRATRNPGDFFADGALLPLGGEIAGHKGYALALASALIGGLAMIDDPEPVVSDMSIRLDRPDQRGRIGGVFLLVIDPAAFGDAGKYRVMVDETLGAAQRVPPVSDDGEVLVPGEPEIRNRRQRSRQGVIIPASTWQDLTTLADRFHLPLPLHQCR